MKTNYLLVLSLILIVSCEEGPLTTTDTSHQQVLPTQEQVIIPSCAKHLLRSSQITELNRRSFFQFIRSLGKSCYDSKQREKLRMYLIKSNHQHTTDLLSDVALIFNFKGE